MKKKKIKSRPEPKWKKRPSELKDFDTACYHNHDSGDYLRIDYSVHDNRVRVYVEIKGQSSDSYCVEIINGRISERSSSEKCYPGDVDLVFEQRIKFFYDAPLKKALKEIRKVFNPEIQTDKTIAENISVQEEKFSLNKLLMKYNIADYFDFSIGIIMTVSVFFYFGMSHSISGFVSAVFGVITGAVDILIRHRKPVFSKILFFLITGLILYVYALMY